MAVTEEALAALAEAADRESTRLAHQEALDTLLAPIEEAFAEAIGRVMTRALGLVGLSLTAAGLETVDPAALGAIQAGWAKEVLNLAPLVTEVYEAGALSSWLAHKGPFEMAKADPSLGLFDTLDAGAVSHMAGATNRISRLGEQTWDDMRRFLTTAIEQGWDVEQTTRVLKARFAVAENRARTIARTETIGAANAGAMDGVKAMGKYGPRIKEWMASGDARTRDSHYVADGQRRPINVPFDVGGVKMQRPHAIGAPAREVVNCRCTIVFDESGKELLPDGGEPDVTPPEPDPVPTFGDPSPSDALMQRHLAGKAENVQEAVNDQLAGASAYQTGDFAGDAAFEAVTLQPDDWRHYYATQNSVDVDNVRRLATEGADLSGLDPDFPVVVARVQGRNVIVDGHHRALAAAERGEPIRVWRLKREVSDDDLRDYGTPAWTDFEAPPVAPAADLAEEFREEINDLRTRLWQDIGHKGFGHGSADGEPYKRPRKSKWLRWKDPGARDKQSGYRPTKALKDMEERSTAIGRRVDEEVRRRLRLRTGFGVEDVEDNASIIRARATLAKSKADALYDEEFARRPAFLSHSDKHRETMQALQRNPEWVEAERVWSDAGDRIARLDMEVRDAYAATLREVLDEIEPMGRVGVDRFTVSGRPAATLRESLDEAAAAFPRRWIDRSNEMVEDEGHFFDVTESSDRAWHGSRERGAEMQVPTRTLSPEYATETTVHELGHHMEQYIDGVGEMETAFYWRRVGSEQPRRLADITGNAAYKVTEVAREDRFSNPYMGKEYGRVDAWELFTMGVQYLLSPKASGARTRSWGRGLLEDEDYRSWLIGVMLNARPI